MGPGGRRGSRRGQVTFIDPNGLDLQSTVAVGSHPRACVWDSANPRWLYVAVEDEAAVEVIDSLSAAVVTTIPVGRLPAGLAVSATRREVYVTHRIDSQLTVIDLAQRQVAAEIPLADEPFSAVLTPNGKPLAFESMALTSDGTRAWLPHELLAPTHPFVFDETLFPAVSVADLNERVEQQTDPNSPDIDGRKNLLDAIDLIDDNGQPDVFSQFCGVVMHPNGLIA